MKLTKAKLNEMPAIYSHMKNNFIYDEIRDYDDAVKVFDNEKYSIYYVIENDEKVGFMCVWDLVKFVFLEHFVIYEQYRCNGYGGKAFDLLKNRSPALILECEPPEGPDQKRRWDFYLRHGMIGNQPDYWQPPYRKDGQSCYLKIMSSIKLVNFKDIVRALYTEVYQAHYE